MNSYLIISVHTKHRIGQKVPVRFGAGI